MAKMALTHVNNAMQPAQDVVAQIQINALAVHLTIFTLCQALPAFQNVLSVFGKTELQLLENLFVFCAIQTVRAAITCVKTSALHASQVLI